MYNRPRTHELIFQTEDGKTLKTKVVHDIEWGEWQIRVLELIGNRWVNHKDLMTPAADKQDAISTMAVVADGYKKAGVLDQALSSYKKEEQLQEKNLEDVFSEMVSEDIKNSTK